MKFFAGLLLLFCGIFLAAGELTILAVSDSHAECWKWRDLAEAIGRHRASSGAENTLLLDAGDTLQGNWFGTWQKGAIPMAILNELRVDAWVPGNHDFDHPPEVFRQFKGALLGGDWHTEKVRPAAWRMFDRAGHKIAVIGLGEWGMRRRVLPERGITFADPDEVLAQAVKEALAAGAELLILLQHDGEYGSFGPLSRRLRKFPEIRLVIGAHTHQEVPGKKIGSAWFVQPGSHGEYLGVIRVKFPGNGEAPVITSSLEKMDFKTRYRYPRPIFQAMQASLRAGREWIGSVPGGLARPTDRDMKGAFGDLAEKALLQSAGADLCIFSMYQGQIRSPEKVTAASLFRVYPYGSRIYRVSMTSGQLEEFLRELLKFQRKKRDLAIRLGGMKVYRDKRGFLQRMVLPEAGKDGLYHVAMTDYEWTGCAGGVPAISRRFRQGAAYLDTGVLLRDAMARVLAAEKNLQSGKKGVSYQK